MLRSTSVINKGYVAQRGVATGVVAKLHHSKGTTKVLTTYIAILVSKKWLRNIGDFNSALQMHREGEFLSTNIQ